MSRPVEPGMNRLIEEFLRTRGVRYFRGHHDEEYFYLVDFVVGAHRCRLNVHLEVCDADREGVRVSITPDRYYPAARRDALDRLATRWNAVSTTLQTVVHQSCDPSLVGVLATGQCRPRDAAALSDFVEAAVASAVGLFGSMAPAQAPDVLRDAG